MAALASAKQGHRAFSLHDWLIVYTATWIMPAPVGAIMLGVSLGLSWGLRAMGMNVPFDSGLIMVYFLGWAVLFAPVLSWIALAVSVPLVWAGLRFGWGGWLCYGLGGVVIGWIASWAIGGITPLAPIALGLISALFLRLLMGMLRPQVFSVEKM